MAALLGGGFSLTAHGAKASTRALANTSPEPVSNVTLSFAEDGVVAGMVALALAFPVIAGVVATVFADRLDRRHLDPVPHRPQPPPPLARPPGCPARARRRPPSRPDRPSVTAELRRAGRSPPLRRSGWPTSAGGPTPGSARPGRVCHLAVGPGVEVVATLVPRAPVDGRARAPGPRGPAVDGDAAVRDRPGGEPGLGRTGHRRRTRCSSTRSARCVERVELPAELAIELVSGRRCRPVRRSGTSASVVVALLGGARRARRRRSAVLADEIARLAHQVETERVGREAGVQDQWAAALGGVGLLAVGPYPDVRHEPIALAAATPTSSASGS